MLRRLPFVAFVLCSFVALYPSSGFAQEDNADADLDDKIARSHYQAGDGHYQAGRFEQAAAEFEKAYALSKRPTLLYNLYVAYRDAGKDEPAAANLERYLEQVPDADDRVNLEARLAALQKQIAERKRVEEAAAGQEQAEQAAAAPAESPEAAPKDDGLNLGAWILIGTGGAAVLTGVVTGILAAGDLADLEDQCPNDTCPADFDLDDEKSGIETLAIATDVLIIGGAALAAGGVIWLLLDDGDAEHARGGGPRFSGGCTTHGCSASLSGRF